MYSSSHRSPASLLALVLLAGCGGGGSESASTPVAVVPAASTPSPTPTPTPTATPIPVPIATPTPTPTGGYEMAFDFSRGRVFMGEGVELTYNLASGSDVPINIDAAFPPAGGVVTVQYAIGSRTMTVDYAGVEVTYDADEILADAAGSLTYSRAYTDARAGGVLVIRQPGPQYGYINQSRHQIREAYAPAGGTAGTTERHRYLLLGAPTDPSEVPGSGAASFATQLTMQLAGPTGLRGLTASGPISVDWITGNVTGTLSVTGNAGEAITLNFSGRVGPVSKTITGTLTSEDGEYTGSFFGRPFGPGAVEIGLLFTLAKADGTRAIGEVVGRAG